MPSVLFSVTFDSVSHAKRPTHHHIMTTPHSVPTSGPAAPMVVVQHQQTTPTSASGTPTIFSPMEQMEELDVVAGYCYDEEVANLEKALGIDFQDTTGNPAQKELIAK